MKSKFALFLLSLSFCLFLSLESAQAQPYRGMSLSPYVTDQDIVDLLPWKVNVVRYMLGWTELVDIADEATYNSWLDDSLARLDRQLPLFGDKVKVILTLGNPPGGYAWRVGQAQHRMFSEAWAQAAFVRVWQKIAAHYVGNTTIIGFDLVNEPAIKKLTPGLKEWRTLAIETAKAIRVIDPSRRLIVEPLYGDQINLKKLPPLPLKNIVYSIHMYYPWKFVHQGLYGVKRGQRYPSSSYSKAVLKRYLQKTASYQRKNKVDIYVGEFTAARWAPGDSAYLYLKDVVSILESYKWHWTYHIWREADAWSVEHGSNYQDASPSPTLTKRARLLQSYFKKNKF